MTTPFGAGSAPCFLKLRFSTERGESMRYRAFLGLCLFASLAILAPTLSFGQAQANTGTIEGVVTDPSGRTVPKAMVTLTNVGTNFTRVLETDEEGRFRGLLLPLGPYKLTVKVAGFATI